MALSWTLLSPPPRPCLASALDPSSSHLSLQSSRCSFFGFSPATLQASHPRLPGTPLHRSKFPLITARIKWRKYVPFDNVIQNQKKLKLVSKIKDILVKQPGMVMSLRDLGKYRKPLGLRGKRKCTSLLRKYPAVFELFEEGVCSLYFGFTQEAEEQFIEELRIREEMEGAIVEKIRKLLMMSIDKRILIEKIGHIRRELGLPEGFRESFLPNYPHFFKIVETGGGPALELTSWDPKLAVTAYEKKKEEEDRLKEASDTATTISGRVPKFRKVDLPKGYTVSRKDRDKIIKFLDMPFVSPYADFTQLDPSSPEAEKHAVAVVHELLSLSLEKRTLVDHLTHFRRDFKFSQRIRAMLIRHPEFFYVSLKGDRDSVFLRDAYDGSELIEKDPLVLAKEKLGELVAAARKRGRSIPGSDDEDEDEDEEDGDDDLEEGDFEDDDWSDNEDENMSLSHHLNNKGGFDDLQMKEVPTSQKHKRLADRLQNRRDRELVTVNPTPRERW